MKPVWLRGILSDAVNYIPSAAARKIGGGDRFHLSSSLNVSDGTSVVQVVC